MSFASASGRLLERIAGHPSAARWCAGLFIATLAGCFVGWPIVMYDSDLWYHLAGGRHLWQHGEIPGDAFFSYVDPPKRWYNYYWLFQAVVYGLFEAGGYPALVALRALLCTLTALVIALLLLGRRPTGPAALIAVTLLAATTLVIVQRELLLRPHMFSYLFIALFLYLLESRRDRLWALPPLALLWSNLHGIEYPVMFLILAAYLAEIGWRERKGAAPGEAVPKATKWCLIACFYTIFLTPGSTGLLPLPFATSFETAAHQQRYVAELLPFSFRNLFVFAPVSPAGAIAAIQNGLVLLIAALFVREASRRRLRVSHALLFLGALPLLATHARFSHEFVLLSLPLLRQALVGIGDQRRPPGRRHALLMPLLGVLLPGLILLGTFANRPAYPFSETNLPAGVVRFLNRHAPPGRILNEPNSGGYLPWALAPGFRIHMDMQMSIFSDTDFATAQNAFADPNVFAAFVARYQPDYISVSLQRPYFRRIVEADPRFVPVFFDQAELLYVDRNRHAGLAERFALREIDPFALAELRYDALDPKRRTRMFDEAARIAAEDPGSFGANRILAAISVARERYDDALAYAEAMIARHPELPHGHALSADARMGLGRYAEAARLYERALALGQRSKQENVYWNLHAAYVKQGDYRKGYRLLSRYVNPFAPDADYREIGQLGIAAAAVGKTREAVTFLRIARMKAPASDPEQIEKIERQLSLLLADQPPVSGR